MPDTQTRTIGEDRLRRVYPATYALLRQALGELVAKGRGISERILCTVNDSAADGDLEYTVTISPLGRRPAEGASTPAMPEPAQAAAPTGAPAAAGPDPEDGPPDRLVWRLGPLEREILKQATSEPMSRKALARRCGRHERTSSFYQVVRTLIAKGYLRQAGDDVALTEKGEQAKNYL
jgi:hypothetical protein